MTQPTADTPLHEAQAWLRGQLAKGTKCPLCTQKAKIYRRPLNGKQARALILLFKTYRREYGHMPSVLPARDNGMLALLRYWNLVEEMDEDREDGGRAGYWRITPHGEDWLFGRVKIPKYVNVYASIRTRAPYGPEVTLGETLGVPFDLRELDVDDGPDRG